MKQKLTLFAFILFSITLKSQSVPMALENWKTTLGTQNFFYKTVTKTDAFGNVYVAGATINGAGNTDILLAKYSPAGVQLWIRQYAGAGNGTDFAAGLAVTDTYAYLTGAVTTGTASLQTDAITIKYSAAGVLQWATTYAGSAGLNDAGKHVVLDGSGNVYITGGSYNSSANSDFLTVKYNVSGTQQWASTYNYSSAMDDAAIKVVVSGSNLTVTGAVTSSANKYKYATLTYAQSNGSLTATNISAAVTTTSVDVVTDLATDGSGNIYVIGNTNVSGQGKNFYVQKLSTTLVTAWTYTFNGTANLDDIAKGIAVDASGNVFVTGFTTSSTLAREITTIKLNSSGTQQWVKYSSFAGNDEANDLVLDASANAYITGYRTNGATTNYYTVKYDASGTKQWEVECDDQGGNDTGTNITLDSLNNVIVTGQGERGAPGTFEFVTVKYVQKDVITPTDFNGEVPSQNFLYYRNSGQLKNTSGSAIPNMKFYTNQTNPSFYFQNKSHSFVFAKVDTLVSTSDTLHRIDMAFNNSNEVNIYAMEAQENNYLNYYSPSTGSAGITNVKGHQRLITSNLYNNIDLMYSSNQNGIKYYFIVKPGGDMRDIDMEFTGATSFSLDGSTNKLSINSTIGSLTYDRPTAYQLTAGNATMAVTGWTPDWQTNGATNKYKFNTGAYTSSLTLIIEVDQGNATASAIPIGDLCWSTYFGGDGYDAVYGITKDNLGNQYVAGGTMSTDFPVFNGPFQGALLGEVGAFYSKFGTSNQQLYTTYYAGCGADKKTTFWDIKCKNSNEVVVAGYTTCNSLVLQSTGSAYYDNSFSGPEDGFVASFNAIGNLTWASYLGGGTNSDDRIQAIDFDSNGNLYVVGVAGSGFPLTTTPNYNQSYAGTGDGFITKFNTNYGMVWSTCFGGSDVDGMSALKIDNADRLMIFGYTQSTNLPCYATGSAYADNSLGGAVDNFVSVFSSNAQQLWTAYIGGSSTEAYPVEGLNSICSSANSIFIAGSTQSSNFPVSNPGGSAFYDNTLSANSFPTYDTGDGYIMEFDKTTFQRQWGTLVSGNGASIFRSVVVDANGNLFVSGCTGDHTMPFTSVSGAYNDNTFNGGGVATTPSAYEDGVILSFRTSDRRLNWCTLFGGYNDHPYGDDIYDMMILGNEVYIGGMTTDKHIAGTTNIPLVDQGNGNYFKNMFGGSFQDAIITKFCAANIVGIDESAGKDNSNQISVYPNPAETFINISGTNFSGEVNVTIYNASGQIVLSTTHSINGTAISQKIANLATGLYIVKVTDNNHTYTSKFIKQ